jgi:hypothetical protein
MKDELGLMVGIFQISLTNDERGLMLGVFQISNLKLRVRRGLARMATLAAIVLAAFGHPSAGFAQSCPACYANAAQAAGMLHSLKTGILVMMLPCLAMFMVIFAVAYRRRAAFNAESSIERETAEA